jgi:hypothetical protein
MWRRASPSPDFASLNPGYSLFDISNERGSTIVFPFPLELLEAFKGPTQPRT